MEKITINNTQKKFTRPDDKGVCKPFWVIQYYKDKFAYQEGQHEEATIGAWDVQLADYLEKDVGYGGTVLVEITQKGNYTNITGVDMTSGVKLPAASQVEAMGNLPSPKQMNTDNTTVKQEKFRSPKEIVACVLTECWVRTIDKPTPQEHILEAYNFFLENL